MPKVSICMLAYKHGAFISRAIDSILAQQVSFDYEVVIGDDFSQDGTAEKLAAYAQKHPGKIKVMPRPSNVGAVRNLIETYEACTGEYIGFLEGDDFWTFTGKLQQQVDFLDRHPDFSLAFHSYEVLQGKRKKPNAFMDIPAETDIHYLLRRGNYIKTLTAIYRNNPKILDWYKSFDKPPVGDYLVFLGAAQYGKLKYFPNNWGVYRAHAGGNWSRMTLRQIMPKHFNMITALADRLPASYTDDLRVQLINVLEADAMAQPDQWAIDEPAYQPVFEKMGLEKFVLEYIRYSVTEKKKDAYYTRNVPASQLAKSLVQKIRNQLPRI